MRNCKPRTRCSMVILIVLICGSLAAVPVSAQDYAPTPPPGIVYPPTGCSGGEIDVPPGMVDVPPGTFCDDDYSLVFKPPAAECPPPVGCLVFDTFDLTIYLDIDSLETAHFDPPLTVCMDYTDSQAEALGGPDNLAIAYWDDELRRWIPLDNIRVDTEKQQICGDISVLVPSECGIGLTCLLSPTAVPVTGSGALPKPVLSFGWPVLVGAILLALRLVFIRRPKAATLADK